MSGDAYLYSSESDEEFAAAADSEEEDGAGGREEDGMQLGNVVIETAGGGGVLGDAYGAPPPSLNGAQALKVRSPGPQGAIAVPSCTCQGYAAMRIRFHAVTASVNHARCTTSLGLPQPHPRSRCPVSPPAPPPLAPTPSPQLPSFQFAAKRRQHLDGRVLLLFDINGVLMQHRWTGTSHQHDLRPGVHHLLRLLPHFRWGAPLLQAVAEPCGWAVLVPGLRCCLCLLRCASRACVAVHGASCASRVASLQRWSPAALVRCCLQCRRMWHGQG